MAAGQSATYREKRISAVGNAGIAWQGIYRKEREGAVLVCCGSGCFGRIAPESERCFVQGWPDRAGDAALCRGAEGFV